MPAAELVVAAKLQLVFAGKILMVFIKYDRKYNRKKMDSVRFEPETPQLRTTRVSARLFESSHCIPNIYKLSSDG